MKNNMYVIVRGDLGRSQKAVQGIHASSELLLKHGPVYWDNGTVVFLKVRNEEELKEVEKKINASGEAYSFFREPDLDNQMTAIATFGKTNLFPELTLA